MPPIRKGDGTAVAPKGISQVRTGDGRILFDRFAIPDSAIYHWMLDEGAGSTAEDSVGTLDADVVGASWVSGDWEGDYALDGDGSSDYLNVGELGSFGSKIGDGVTILMTIETTDDDVYCAGTRDGGVSDMIFYLTVGNQSGSHDESGKFGMGIRDSSRNDVRAYYDGSDVNDGDKHRVVMATDGTSDNTEIWQDGSENTGIDSTGSGDDWNDFDDDFYFFGRNNSGIDGAMDGVIDNIMICDEILSSSEIQDDYDNQPWS